MYKLTFFLSTRGRGPVIVPPFGVSCLLVFSAAPRLRPAFGLLPRPRGGRGSIGDTPREGGDEPPLRGTVDSWTDVSQNSVKSVSPPHTRGILCQNSDTIIEKIALTLTRAVYCCLSEI